MNPTLSSRIVALHDRVRLLREDAARRTRREEQMRQRRQVVADELLQALQPLAGLPLCRHDGAETYRSVARVGADNHRDHHCVVLSLSQGIAVCDFHVRSDPETDSPYITLAGGATALSVEDALTLAVAAAETHFDDSADVITPADADDIPF